MRDVSAGAGEPLRVLIYEPYPFTQIAGNLRTLVYILRWTDRARFHLTLAVPFDTGLLAQARAFGADTVVLAPPTRINRYGQRLLNDRWYQRLRTIPDLVRYSRTIYRCLRARRIDVIYCNGIRAVLTVALAAIAARTPRVWYVKGTLDNGVLDRLGFLLASRILFFAAANRDDRYRGFVRWRRRDIGIVKIGLDLDEVRQAADGDRTALAREFALDRGQLAVAFVGQLYPPKGVTFLIEAFARVAPRFPGARLFLIGDPVLAEYGDYGGVLRELVDRLGLGDRVVFTGWRQDALALVSLMDVLVHPSLAEGFGRAVLEAMALGRPVIASAVGGLREAIQDGDNGFLVPPKDVAAIADRLARLLGDAPLRQRMGERARETVIRDHLIADKVSALGDEWARAASRAGARAAS